MALILQRTAFCHYENIVIFDRCCAHHVWGLIHKSALDNIMAGERIGRWQIITQQIDGPTLTLICKPSLQYRTSCVIPGVLWMNGILPDDVINDIFSVLLAFCEGNSPVTGEPPSQRPVTRSFGVSFELRPKKRLSKQSIHRWFETPSRILWRHCNVPDTNVFQQHLLIVCLHDNNIKHTFFPKLFFVHFL